MFGGGKGADDPAAQAASEITYLQNVKWMMNLSICILQRLKLWQKSRQRKHWQWLRANAVFLNCMISFLPSTFCYIISYIISIGFELCNCHSQYAVRVDVSCHVMKIQL